MGTGVRTAGRRHRHGLRHLLAAIGDVAQPLWRARAVGVYRLWRDSGYAAGAIVGGITADLWGLRTAIWAAAAITVSGVAVAVRKYETHPRERRSDPPYGK